ncbi:MAG TPA: alpha/beta hydrolase [Actinophytocola sp.]|uniref:alpha/beta fold hydrolase n=1 Tax=Actinophytocola sp. TaxID=1872138 RepID=UPI002DBA39FE|nr:alpha/beta hydrolase [Actinophytocola sp.]HEU5470487.1 alpha/beta hydrolase [Actinophytocola sp.]
MTIVLVHSPFLGPASLRPLADALGAEATPTVLLDLRPSVVAPPVHQVLLGVFADVIGDAALPGPVVLVGHSGAGPLLPAFADTLEDSVAGLVYLDAGLPTPGRSWRDTVPPELYTRLRDRTREGLLPRWHLWFDPDPLAPLDPALRADIADEAPEVPLAFLKEARPDVEWPGPAGYVALSSAYDPDLTQARSLGWPVAQLDSSHLAPATDPDPVARAILQVMSQMLA